jgi:hypothetical protein
MMSMLHAASLHEYLDDVRAAVSAVRTECRDQAKIKATY